MESMCDFGAECGEALAQNAGVGRMSIEPDHEAARFLVAQVPGNRLAARERWRQIEIEPATRELYRITARHSVRARHVPAPVLARSEEHTSELQSRGLISYAV